MSRLKTRPGKEKRVMRMKRLTSKLSSSTLNTGFQ
jgi:hypothetical protein